MKVRIRNQNRRRNAVFAAALMFCAVQPLPGLTGEPDFDLGCFVSGEYKNSFLGLSLKPPRYWKERDFEQYRKQRERIKKLNLGSAKRHRIDFSGERSLPLFKLYLEPAPSYSGKKPGNADPLRRFDPSRLPLLDEQPGAPALKGSFVSFSGTVEKLPYERNGRTPAGFMVMKKKREKIAAREANSCGDVREVKVGGAPSAAMDCVTNSPTFKFYSIEYVTIRRGLVLSFVFVCDNREDMVHLGPVINSLRFTDGTEK